MTLLAIYWIFYISSIIHVVSVVLCINYLLHRISLQKNVIKYQKVLQVFSVNDITGNLMVVLHYLHHSRNFSGALHKLLTTPHFFAKKNGKNTKKFFNYLP